MLFRDVLQVAATQGGGTSDPTAGFALYFSPYENRYRGSGGKVGSASAMTGYSYSRTVAKSELNASGSPTAFAANTPGLISGTGYWSRASITNTATQSQSFDNAAWSKTGGSITADQAVAPDGTTTADLFTEDTSIGAHQIFSAISYSITVTYTLSIYAKAGTGSVIQLVAAPTSGFANFDLNAGTFSVSGANCSASITPAANGFYRCTFTFLATGTSTNAVILLIGSLADARGATHTGTSKTVYFWQAQNVIGSDPGPIIPTTTTSVTVGADTLAFTVANGTYTETTTFDDASTQTRSVTVSGTTYNVPVYPTTFNRPLVRKITLA